MSDTIKKLNAMENEINEFSLKYMELLGKIRDYLCGGIYRVNEDDFKIDDLIKKLIYIKEDLHKQVDEIYKEESYQHVVKLQNDLTENLNSIHELKNRLQKMSSIQNFQMANN
jgi:hypothetical protein